MTRPGPTSTSSTANPAYNAYNAYANAPFTPISLDEPILPALPPPPPAPGSNGNPASTAALLGTGPTLPAIPRNDATRSRVGLLARLGAWFGYAAGSARSAVAAQLGTSELARRGNRGAPLDLPAGVPAIDEQTMEHVRTLRSAIGFLATDPAPVFRTLEQATPAELARIDQAFGWGYGGHHLSLREAINHGFSGTDRRHALDLLEDAQAVLRRPPNTPRHDYRLDPSGLFGPSGDGRLPQTIDKLFELRRLRKLTKADLVNRHEVTGNNRVTMLAGGERAFAEILKAIDGADKFVHVSFFIFKDDEHGKQLTERLIAAAARGVKVRVTFDECGDLLARAHSASRLMRKLRNGGIEVARNHIVDAGRATSLFNRADHRKTVVVDGKVAFTGGMNIGTDYITEWRDHMLKVEGGAVHQLNVEWSMNWLGLGKELDPKMSDDELRAFYFPTFPTTEHAPGTARVKVAQSIPGESDEVLRSYVQMIDRAEHSIWIECPYITASEIQEALLRARRERKVDIKIIIPAENNHPYCDYAARGPFKEMIQAGIEIAEYPGMCHGKVMVVDDRYAIAGTSNLDDMSLKNVYELNLHIDDEASARQILADVFEIDLARSRALSAADISSGELLASKFWRMFSTFL